MIGKFFTLVCVLTLLTISGAPQNVPVPADLEEVAQLPPNIPQRVMALAFHDDKLWLAIYHDRGSYVTYDPVTKQWDTTPDVKLKDAIAGVTGRFSSAGGMVFVDDKLWVSSAYGESFGSIELSDPRQQTVYKGVYSAALDGKCSQSYADLTYDGRYLWAAWHAFYYKRDGTETQLLLKIDKDSGKVLEEFPIAPRMRKSGAHGLTWDGHSLWHGKENWITEYDLGGVERSQFELEKVNRISGLAWDGSSLWIVEFGGKLWRLPFRIG